MKDQPYGMVPKKCPDCGAKMRSKVYVAASGMVRQQHVCPKCGKIVDRAASTMHFPDRDAI